MNRIEDDNSFVDPGGIDDDSTTSTPNKDHDGVTLGDVSEYITIQRGAPEETGFDDARSSGVVSLEGVEVEETTLGSDEFDIFEGIEPADAQVIPYFVEELYEKILEKKIIPTDEAGFTLYAKNPRLLTLAIVHIWQNGDKLNGDARKHLSLALAYADAIMQLHYDAMSNIKTPMDAVNASAAAVIDFDGIAEKYQEGWAKVLYESIKNGELHPALLYLDADKWLALCESGPYKTVFNRALENLRNAMPGIIEAIAPERIEKVHVVGLGIGGGQKDYEVVKAFLDNGLDVEVDEVDASLDLLKTGIINMVKKILLHVLEENPSSILQSLGGYCDTHKDQLPYFSETGEEQLSEDVLSSLLERIVGKFTTPGFKELKKSSEQTGSRDYELFNHLTAAILGLHTSNKDLLEELNALRRQLRINPQVNLFRKVEPEPKPTTPEEIEAASKEVTLICGLGNAPLGNNPPNDTLMIFDRLLKSPTVPERKRGERIEECDINADYALIGVHLRLENEETAEKVNPYATPQFKDFVTHPLTKLEMIRHCDSETEEPLSLEDVGKLQDTESETDQETGFRRNTHKFVYSRGVNVKVGGKILKKKKGEVLLTHYSYSFTLPELNELLARKGFQIVKTFVDESGKDAKILFRKMTDDEERQKLTPRRLYRVLRRSLPQKPEPNTILSVTARLNRKRKLLAAKQVCVTSGKAAAVLGTDQPGSPLAPPPKEPDE